MARESMNAVRWLPLDCGNTDCEKKD